MENHNAKLRERVCVQCGIKFWKHISPYAISKGYGIICGKKCWSIYHKRYRKGTSLKCEKCGQEYYVRPSVTNRKYPRRFCSLKCSHPNIGKHISLDGYNVRNNKKVHRLIMEAHLGRKLLPEEIIHHINENRLDNRIENLQVVTRAEHAQIHKFLVGHK